MEELLFRESRRLTDCLPNNLLYPEAQFVCSEGFICYHFSRTEQKFILTHFELTKLGGGLAKQSSFCNFLSGKNTLCANGPANGIAARLAIFFNKYADHMLVNNEQKYFRFALTQDNGSSAFLRLANLFDGLPAENTLRDIAQTYLTISSNRWSHMHALPVWSLLSHFKSVPEQLHSPYARSILAGEALCRLSSELSSFDVYGRALRRGPIRESKVGPVWIEEQSDLLYESEAIIEAIVSQTSAASLNSSSRHYFTACLVDGDILTDDCRLGLIRNEMTLRLATVIHGEAKALQHSVENVLHNKNEREVFSRLLRKYSHMSEFVRISRKYFGNFTPDVEEMRCSDERYFFGRRDKISLSSLASRLCELGNSTSLIVENFSACEEDLISDPEDMLELRHRLIFLTKEILDAR